MEDFFKNFSGMLNSVAIKITDEDAEKVLAYCEEHEMLVSKFKTDKPDLPNRFTVWGTKKQLQEFREFF